MSPPGTSPLVERDQAPDAVVVGASAGGVEALQTVLGALQADFPAVVLIVQHLPPNQVSGLAPLLGLRCALPVAEAIDKAPLRPGQVVLAPPNYHLLVEPDRTMALSIDAPVHYSRPSIDVLFESAAPVYRDRLLGVLLTGANADGADGLAAIRRAGGRAWVQDPADAAHPEMPTAALQNAGADLVLDLAALSSRLRRCAWDTIPPAPSTVKPPR